MMRCLVVGADRIHGLCESLRQVYGYTDIIHWDGRTDKLPNRLPDVQAVYILTGYIRHSVVFRVRDMAKKQQIPVYYLTRGKASLWANHAHLYREVVDWR